MQIIKEFKADKDNVFSSFIQKYFIYIFVAVTLWLKSYVVYMTEFNLGVSGWFQHILLLINPLSISLLLVSLSLFVKPKRRYIVLIAGQFFLAVWLYVNVVYYRFFGDFITVQTMLSLQNNAGQVGGSFFSLIRWYDFLFFFDVLITGYLIVKIKKKKLIINEDINRKACRLIFIATICIGVFNLGLAEMDRPQLLSRTFDRNYIVKYLGLYNFAMYDSVKDMMSMTQRALAQSDDAVEVVNYSKSNYKEPNDLYFGKAAGRNVVYVSLESLQKFILDYKYADGTEVTPFLNSLMRDSGTFYFSNIFDQAGQGKTSDAEFMIDTGLFPLREGSVYVNKAQNVYHSGAEILRQAGGYYSSSLHGNYKTFWNRNEMYRSMGYDNFFDAEYYDMNDEDVKNYGLKDKPFLEQSTDILSNIPQPFYTKLITLSNHFPFGMDDWDTEFPVGEYGSTVVNQYFQSANYLDEALRAFFEGMKQRGLYDNSIFVLYGDHHGISSAHNEALAKVIGKEEITPYDQAYLRRVVFMIHAPGLEGGTFDTHGGLSDVRSTVLHLLGVDTKDYISLGTDLLAPNRDDIAVLRNGDFISTDYAYISEKFYDNLTGELIDVNEEDEQADQRNGLIEYAKTKLEMSDKIIAKDLLRFYTPDGYSPTDPEDHVYLKPDQNQIDNYRQKNLVESEQGE